MKILVCSYVFAPSLGGIESVSTLLVREWSSRGHELALLTLTPDPDGRNEEGCRTIRNPSRTDFRQAAAWADVIFQNNLSLRLAKGLLGSRRPWVVTTQTWLNHGSRLAGVLKQGALRLVTRVYISEAIKDHVGLPGIIIPNPYDDRTFNVQPDIPRSRELLFVGRLVADKGADLLLQALAALKVDCSLTPHLTIAGEGPELEALRTLTAALGLQEQVRFVGRTQGADLGLLFNGHRICVVPSRWAEPFGIVALEAIACGCFVIGSSEGGLPEAIGPCGHTFQNGDVSALASRIAEALKSGIPGVDEQTRADHLSRFRPGAVAERYLELFSSVLA